MNKTTLDKLSIQSTIEMFHNMEAEHLRLKGVRHLASLETLDIAEAVNVGANLVHKSSIRTSYSEDVIIDINSWIQEIVIKDLCTQNDRWAMKPVTIRHPGDIYSITSRFPFNIFFGINLYESFNCELPGHMGGTHSARFEQLPNGKYVYHCYSCNVRYDFFDFLERITGWNHTKTMKFICRLLNITYESEWQRERKEDIARYQEYLVGDLEDNYPELYQHLKNRRLLGMLDHLLSIARRYLYDQSVTASTEQLFVMSLRTMHKKLNDLGDNMSLATLQRRLKQLNQMGLIKTVPEEEVPPIFAKELSLYRQIRCYKYHTNVFVVPEFRLELFEKARLVLQNNIDKNVRMSYYQREAEIRANGMAAANKQYVQDINRKTLGRTDAFYGQYKKVAKELLAKKRWTTEQEILAKVRGYDTSSKKQFSGRCLPQLLRELTLERIRYTKALERKYAVPKGELAYGCSKIIIPKEGISCAI